VGSGIVYGTGPPNIQLIGRRMLEADRGSTPRVRMVGYFTNLLFFFFVMPGSQRSPTFEREKKVQCGVS
jgi:hypothetical protein